MTVTERSTHITKENIWKKPDWRQQIADGKSQALAYWQNKMRQAIPPRPPKDDEPIITISRIFQLRPGASEQGPAMGDPAQAQY